MLFVIVLSSISVYSADLLEREHLRPYLLSKDKQGLRRLKGLFYNINLPLERRLLLQGMTRKEIRFIKKRSRNSEDYKYFYEYELGIAQIKFLLQSLQWPAILVIEGHMSSGKSTLTRRLETGRDLGIDPLDIGVFHEGIISPTDYDELEMKNITKLFLKTLQGGKKAVIYDGHFFIDHVRRLPSVYDRTKELLKKYCIIRVKVGTIWDKEGRLLTQNGDFIPPPNFSDPELKTRSESIKRYVLIEPDAIVQERIETEPLLEEKQNLLKVKMPDILKRINFRCL